jgi:ABC-type microcin C transport system permease subunit YejE
MSLKKISFDLRTTGLTTLEVLNRLKVPGSLIPTPAIVPIFLVQNLRTFVEYLSIGLKASQTFLSSLPTAI